MKHDKFRELIHLAVADEIAAHDMRALNEHLNQCDSCQVEFKELQRLKTLLGKSGAREPSEEMLWEARQDLREALAKEVATESMSRATQSVAPVASRRSTPSPGRWTSWFGGLQIGLSAAAAVVVGVFIGYLAFGQQPTAVTGSTPPALDTSASQSVEGLSINNVRFVSMDPKDGELEIEYDLIRPVHLRAAVDDERMQRVLAYTLLNGDNPGVRLQAINALDGDKLPRILDNDVRGALLASLKTDPNPGVRKRSLKVLSEMPFDDQIKEACLFVLANDENPGLRVAAIDFLSEATKEGHQVEPELYNLLKTKLTSKEDAYLRTRSGLFIEEVEQ